MAKEKKKDLELTAEAPTEKVKKKLPIKLIIIILIGVLVLAIIGGALWFFMSGKEPAKTADTTKVDNTPVKLVYYRVAKVFVIQFAKKDKFTLMKMRIAFLVKSNNTATAIEENIPMLRHRYIDILSEQTGRTLLSKAGKLKLKRQLKEAANHILDQYADLPDKKPIDDVLLTDLVMQ